MEWSPRTHTAEEHPKLAGVPGKDGHPDCFGRYETGEVFSVDIKKDDKPVPSE